MLSSLQKNQAEDFFQSVMVDCGFVGWRVEWYSNTGDGYCWQKRKVISLGPENNQINNLILHEIAHIGTCEKHNNKHSVEWQNKFELLCKKFGEDPNDDGAYRFYKDTK